MRAFVGEQGFPPGQSGLPLGPFRGVGAPFYIVIGRLVRGNQTRACAAFDRHVADRHAAFHRQIADRFAAIFDDVTGAASGAGFADHRHGDVFRGHARLQLAGDFHLHVLRFLLDQRLRCQNMFDLGRADAMRQRAERAVGRGMAVAANDGHAGQGPALFRANDVHDALTHVRDGIIMHAEFARIFVQRLHLNAAFFGHLHRVVAPCGGRHVVVRHGNGLVRCVDLAPRHAQAFKGLGAGHFVHQMAVDIQQAGAIIGFVRDMGVPDFVIECLGRHTVYSRKCGLEFGRRFRVGSLIGWRERSVSHQRTARAGVHDHPCRKYESCRIS